MRSIKDKISEYFLEITVFFSGAIVMIFEIVGSRVLAPFLGTSLVVWTAIIGVILGALSLGYALGGKIADHKASFRGLSGILFLSALFVSSPVFLKIPLFSLLSFYAFRLEVSSVIAALVLFAPASILLGIVSPYSVKLKLRDITTSASTVGRLYAISTLGSIGGTFLAGFFLIPVLGSSKILFILSVLLVILSLMLFFKKNILSRVVALFSFFLCIAGVYASDEFFQQHGLVDLDTQYNHVQIFESRFWENGETILELRLNNERSSAMYPDGDDLVYGYTKFYRLARHFVPKIENALMIGGAGYSYPKDFLRNYSESTLDVVEIDPQLTEIAKQYFSLSENPRLHSIHEDGRIYLNTTEKKYDVIYGDAFSSKYSIPFHLTTQEAVQKQYDALTDDGAVLINIISAMEGEKSDFLRAEYLTFRSVFPQVYLFPVREKNGGIFPQNIMLVALKSQKPPSFTDDDPEINSFLRHRYTKKIPEDLPILTDEYAPVEHYVQKML